MNASDLASNCRSAAALLKSMANEHRLAILCRLATGERSVGELIADVGLSQSALSQHLARLRAEGLVKTRRASQQIFYSLASAEAAQVMETLHGIYCVEPAPPRPIPVPEEVSP
ncbi:ArsR/SmtB family transcription factor [Azospirillum sp. sgz301742]